MKPFHILLLFISLLAIAVYVSGCAMAGYAIGEQKDARLSNREELLFATQTDTTAMLSFFQRHKDAPVVIYSGADKQNVILRDFVIGEYLYVSPVDDNGNYQSGDIKIRWNGIDRIVYGQKHYENRIEGLIGGAIIDAMIVFLWTLEIDIPMPD